MTTIQTKIKEDMKDAMRNRKENPQRLNVIRMIIDRIQKKEKETQTQLTQDEAIQILQTFKKQNNEEMDGYKKANNHTQVTKLVGDNEIIDSYLPQQMTYDQVKFAILSIIDENSDLSGNVNKGLLMKVVIPQLKGKADNRTISEVVTEVVAEQNK